MIPFVFLHVLIDCENFENEIDMDDDSNEKEDRNIFDVFDDWRKTISNCFFYDLNMIEKPLNLIIKKKFEDLMHLPWIRIFASTDFN